MAEITTDEILDAMLTYGGGFVSLLGRLYRQADVENRRRLERAFPEYFTEYADIVRRQRRRAPEAP